MCEHTQSSQFNFGPLFWPSCLATRMFKCSHRFYSSSTKVHFCSCALTTATLHSALKCSLVVPFSLLAQHCRHRIGVRCFFYQFLCCLNMNKAKKKPKKPNRTNALSKFFIIALNTVWLKTSVTGLSFVCLSFANARMDGNPGKKFDWCMKRRRYMCFWWGSANH